MFNLRRSQFVQVILFLVMIVSEFLLLKAFLLQLLLTFILQVFNNTPDETAYFRMLLNRESVTNSVVMIQPSLLSYSFNAPPAPALLDVASIAADRILLLDAYFSVVVFHGMTIAQWRNMGYQNQPEHQVSCDFIFIVQFYCLIIPECYLSLC